jgi:hypothetical protein
MTAIKEEEILANIQSIVDTLQQCENLNSNDLDSLTKYLANVVSLQALATETHASVKYRLLAEKEKVINKILKAELTGIDKNGNTVVLKVSPSIQKLMSECRAKDWEYLYLKTDRLCANVSHTIEAVRTMISLAKQEQYFSNTTKSV